MYFLIKDKTVFHTLKPASKEFDRQALYNEYKEDMYALVGTGEHTIDNIDFNLKEQTTDINCGVFALDFLLQFKKCITIDIKVIEEALKPNNDVGTHPDKITSYLEQIYIPFVESYDNTITHLFNKLPCLVDYQYDGEGHYGVVVSHNETHLSIYNPANGKIDDMLFSDFEERWYDNNFGKRYMLYLK